MIAPLAAIGFYMVVQAGVLVVNAVQLIQHLH